MGALGGGGLGGAEDAGVMKVTKALDVHEGFLDQVVEFSVSDEELMMERITEFGCCCCCLELGGYGVWV